MFTFKKSKQRLKKSLNKKTQLNSSPAFLFFTSKSLLFFVSLSFVSRISSQFFLSDAAVIQMSIAILNYITHSPLHSIINSIHISFEVSNFFFFVLFTWPYHIFSRYTPTKCIFSALLRRTFWDSISYFYLIYS